MLSVGKDRQLAFWKLRNDRKYESWVVYPKAHGRVIWDCCAVFEHSCVVDGKEMAVFATASRDCTVRVFGVTNEGQVTVGDDDDDDNFMLILRVIINRNWEKLSVKMQSQP